MCAIRTCLIDDSRLVMLIINVKDKLGLVCLVSQMSDDPPASPEDYQGTKS